MRPVGGESLLLLLLVGLLVEGVGSELRPRDPELEEQLGGVADTHLVEERGNYPARKGNQCAFVQQRVVSTAVVCGTEQFTIRSRSRCPRGAPDCQLVMYKLSTRPTYRQQQQVVTSLQWRCCPGHSGPNCDTVSDVQMDSGTSVSAGGSEAAVMMEQRPAGVLARPQQTQRQQVDPDREQSDQQGGHIHNPSKDNSTGHAHNFHQPSSDTSGHAHNFHQPSPDTSGHAHILPQQPPDTSGHTHHLHQRPSKTSGHAHNLHQQPPDTSGHAHNLPQQPPDTSGHAHSLPQQPPDTSGHAHKLPQPPSDTSGHTHNLHQPPSDTSGHTHNLQQQPSKTSGHAHNLPQQPPDTSGHTHNLSPVDHQFQQKQQPQQGLLPQPWDAHPQAPEPHLYPHRRPTGSAPQYPDATALLPVPHMMALVMSQLQPVLQSFNHSLEQLSQQVGSLVKDVAELKTMAELRAELVGGAEVLEARERRMEENEEDDEGILDSRVEEVLAQVMEVRLQVEEQRSQLEERLHSQHAMLHYNLTTFKMDVDVKLKRNQKILQTSLQAFNTTLEELKQDRGQIPDLDQNQDQVLALKESFSSSEAPPLVDTSALWEAIERLDATVVNNTVKLGGLQEDVEVFSGDVQQLRQKARHLERSINQTARTSQVQFMETVLEVEAARETVLQQVDGLKRNLSHVKQELQKNSDDLDDLYDRSNLQGSCNCAQLTATVARLEGGVANVTALANENRLALDSDAGVEEWGGAEDWELLVTELKQEVQKVATSLSLASTRSEVLESSLSRLNGSLQLSLAEVAALKESEERLNRLSASFEVLLKDAGRHSQVLEQLLGGEDVLDFLVLPEEEQNEYSVPALLEQLRQHSLSIETLQGGQQPEEREEVPAADQPDSSHLDHWRPDITRFRGGALVRERQLHHHSPGGHLEHGLDGSDLWKLEKQVKKLQVKVLQLEEKQANFSAGGKVEPPAGLQDEVMWLKKGLEDHLRVFKSVFRNADVLIGWEATLELDKLWHLVQRKGKKKRGGAEGGSAKHRTRRDSSDLAVFNQLDDSMLLLETPPLKVTSGVFTLKASADQRQHGNTFTAPVSGTYLFTLSLDLKPGPAVLVLRKREESELGQVSLLHRQVVAEGGPVTKTALVRLKEREGLRVELSGRAWAASEDNLLAVLFLQRAT